MSKKKIHTDKWFKKRIKFDYIEDGITIWVDGLWVLDASCFKDDFTFDIATDKIKSLGVLGDIKTFTLRRNKY